MSFFNKIIDKTSKHLGHQTSGRNYGSNGENAYVSPPASANSGAAYDNSAQNDSSRMSVDSPGMY
jgi:hypothetical protein